MNNKMIIFLIALISIGIYALPSTVALFSGQHSFINIDPTGNQIDCKKCHGDVQSELQGGISSLTGTKAPHADMECSFCHRIESGKSSGDNGYAQVIYNYGAVSRKIALNLIDMEARNFPTQMGPLSTYNDILNASTISGSPMPTKFSLSSCYLGNTTPLTSGGSGEMHSSGSSTVNCNNPSLILLPQNEKDIRIYSLYEAGAPVDKNVQTSNQGFDVTRITWNNNIANLTGAGSRTVNPGTDYHVASVVSCMECHRGQEPTGHDRIVNASDGNACQPCHYGVITIPAPDTNCRTCHSSQSITMVHHAPGLTNYQCMECHTLSNFFERDCNQCHSGIPFPSNPNVYVTTKPHHNNESGKTCDYCHNGTGFTVALDAGGFGLTNNVNDIGDAEVHNTMIRANDGNLTVNGYNTANSGCIACHTHIDVDIRYERQTTLRYTADEDTIGNWSLGNYTATGSNVTIG